MAADRAGAGLRYAAIVAVDIADDIVYDKIFPAARHRRVYVEAAAQPIDAVRHHDDHLMDGAVAHELVGVARQAEAQHRGISIAGQVVDHRVACARHEVRWRQVHADRPLIFLAQLVVCVTTGLE